MYYNNAHNNELLQRKMPVINTKRCINKKFIYLNFKSRIFIKIRVKILLR